MIAQETKRVDLPTKPATGFTQREFERFRSTGSGEQIAPIVSSIDDVIDCTGKLKPKSTGHAASDRTGSVQTPRIRNPSSPMLIAMKEAAGASGLTEDKRYEAGKPLGWSV